MRRTMVILTASDCSVTSRYPVPRERHAAVAATIRREGAAQRTRSIGISLVTTGNESSVWLPYCALLAHVNSPYFIRFSRDGRNRFT